MEKKKRKPWASGRSEDVPAWVDEQAPRRATPYTEEELDLLVESTLESIRDTAAWSDLVDRVGKDEALRELRARLVMRDENAAKATRH